MFNLKLFFIMSKVGYALVQRRNPAKKDAPKLFYAAAQKSGEISFKEIKESIAHSTTATAGDVSLVLESLLRVIKDHLKQGHSILLDEFGIFRLSFSSKGVNTMKEFTTDLIRNIRILFRPCKELKAIKDTLMFEEKSTRKEQIAILKAKKEGKTIDTGGGTTPVTPGKDNTGSTDLNPADPEKKDETPGK